MLKKIFFTGLLVLSAQNVMAVNLSDINEAASTTKKAADKVEQVNDKSISGMAKTVATDSAKEGVNGAVKGVTAGKIVEGGAGGAVDGAKASVNKLMN